MKRASVVTLGSVFVPVSVLLLAGCGSDQQKAPEPSDTETSSSSSMSSGTTTGEQSSIVGTGDTSGEVDTTSQSSSMETAETTGDVASTSETAGTSGQASAEGSTTDGTDSETSGPPADAYVPCSGSALPKLAVEPVVLPPRVNKPIHVLNPPGQADMLYVVERNGAFKRFDLSQAEPTATTLVTLTGVSTAGEMGFLSAALHPNFDGVNERRAYLVYTPAQSFIIKEYTIDGDTATEAGTLFEFTGDTESNHNGGLALFGGDGYLYVGIGDGGGSNDRHGANGNGQNTNTTYGKILRLDVDAPTQPVPGNLTSEQVDGEMVDGRILHYGLRNPWRFSFDRLTDDLYIGDVGQNNWEEIDMIPAGAGPTNLGWAAREGFGECPGCSATIVGLPATDPIYDYENPPGNDQARSVTGGYVYRGNSIPGLYGRYVFADYETGKFTVLTADDEEGACDVIEDAIQQNEIRPQGIASFGEDVNGELFVVSLNDGIFRIVAGE